MTLYAPGVPELPAQRIPDPFPRSALASFLGLSKNVNMGIRDPPKVTLELKPGQDEKQRNP